jgi:hypothetical protein
VRQRGSIHPLGAQYVYIIQFGKLLGRERLARAECHVTCVVHDHIDVPMTAYHAINGSVDGALRDDIHFDRTKIGFVVGRKGLDRLRLSGIGACGLTHSGEDRMPRSRETLRGHESEATRGTGDNDDFVHVGSPIQGGVIRPCRR